MPVDTAIYQNLLRPPKSALEYGQEMDQADTARGQLAAQKLNLIGQQQEYDDTQKLRQLYAKPGFDPSSPDSLPSIFAISPKAGMAAQKAALDAQKTQSEIGLNSAHAGNFKATTAKTAQETQFEANDRHLQDLGGVSTPQDAAQWILDGVKSGVLPEAGLQPGLQRLQQMASKPQGFAQWKQETQMQGVKVGEQLKMTEPKPTEVNLGGVKKFIDTNPRSPTFGKETIPSQTMTATPGEVLSARTSRDNNAATIQKDYKVAGLDGNGNFVGFGGDMPAPAAPGAAAPGAKPAPGAAPPQSPLQGLVQSIGTYKAPENVALARVPPAMRSQVLAEVQKQFPDYDPSTYGSRQKAARDFSTGNQGNAMRSFAVSGQHLDQLGTLIDALGNGNNQTINKVGNLVSAWNGGTAPTNFDAAKDVVSKEVIKAIVGSGGGVGEREELAHQLSNAKSPAQLKGVVQQYRNLMGAQHEALLAQRRAAGLPDSTLPDYGGGAAPGMPGADAIAAELKRRGH